MSNDLWGRDVSESFMYKDLARSGLVPSDFALGIEQLPPNDDGQDRYKFFTTTDYWKVRIDRKENKYVGPKGVTPPIAMLGNFEGARVTATVEGYKKGLLFHITTGIPTVILDGCWTFGEIVENDQEARVKNLASPILSALTPGQDHFVFFDGDWSSNEDVRKALATYRVLLQEQQVNAHFKDLGSDSEGRRLGYDDWFVGEHGIARDAWPDKDTLFIQIAKQIGNVPSTALLGGPLSFMLGSLDRFSSEFLDLNDRGAGSLLIKLIGPENLKYLRDTGEWVRWEYVKAVGAWRWVNLDTNPLGLVNVVAKYYFERAQVLETLAERHNDEEKATQLRKQANNCRQFASTSCSNTTSRGNIIKDLISGGRREIYAYASDFDAKSHLLGVANGVVDLRTGELRAETQDDMITRHCPVPYVVAPPPLVDGGRDIEQFLRVTFGLAHGVEDPVFYAYMQRRLGIALWGGNKLQSFEIWQGAGSDGKSSLALMIQGALGDSARGGYAASTKPEVIMSNYRGANPESASPFLVLLRGARMVFASETKDNSALNEALIKQLSGGERLLARANYQAGGSFKVDFTFFLMTNPMPNCSALDGAMLSRLAILPFKVQWQRGGDQAGVGKHLPLGDLWWVEEAMESHKVGCYLLWWLVQGCVSFLREGTLGELPARCKVAITNYQEEADTISHWMHECNVILAEGEHELVSDLYASYKEFAMRNGNQPMSNISFVKRLVLKYPNELSKKNVTDGKRAITGVKFK